MITIEKISYKNEKNELIEVDFSEVDIEDRADRVNDLVREMLAGGRQLGPPPLPMAADSRIKHGAYRTA